MVTPWSVFEREGWESHADGYHRFFATIGREVAGALLELAGAGHGQRVLDICCGPGYLSAAAAARGAIPVGVDIAANMLALARRLHPGLDFRTADAEALPFPEASFDVATMAFGLHHLEHPERGVREIARVLRGGGRFSVAVWDEDRSGLVVIPDALGQGGAVIPPDVPAPPSDDTYADESALARLLDAGGLRLEEMRTLDVLLEFASPVELFDAWIASAIRSGPIWDAQDAATRRRITEAFETGVEQYRTPTGVAIPVGIRVAAASAP